MNVFIIGGGRIGFHLAQSLSAEEYDVTVIESNPEYQEQLDLQLDAQVVLGDGSSALFLQSLQIEEADLVVACTGNDEINLIAAAAAKGLGAKQVVARVEKTTLVEESFLYEGFLNIDYMLSPDALVAQEIVNYIIYPGVLAAEDFGRGRILLRQVQVSANALAANHVLSEILPPGSGVLVGVLDRNGQTTIPHGSDKILPGDKVTLLGKREQINDALQKFQGHDLRFQRIAVMGGGAIGRRIAHSLEGKVDVLKLFERLPEKAARLATGFRSPQIHVINRDATSRNNLEQEQVNQFDLFIATTEDDERNIIAGVLAREVGVKMSAVVVHHPDFAPLLVKLGIDMAVTPRNVVANSILKLLHQQTVTASAILGEGKVEVAELNVHESSSAANKTLKELSQLLPKTSLITTIIHGDKTFVPSGDDTIHGGDSVVIITMAETMNDVRQLFRRS